MNLRTRFPILLLLLYCVACNTEKKEEPGSAEGQENVVFDKIRWRVKEGLDYPYREQMLHDLVYNDTVRALNKDKILELLGEPDRSNDGYLYYTVAQKRLILWPLRTKTLVIKLSDNSTIDWIKIHE